MPDSDFERMVARDLIGAGLPDPHLHHLVRLVGCDPTWSSTAGTISNGSGMIDTIVAAYLAMGGTLR